MKLRRSISLNDELELLLQSVTGLVRAVQCTKKISLNKSSIVCVCDTVLHVYEPVYKSVVQQRYHLLTCFFSKLT